jgi:hypothetical protein
MKNLIIPVLLCGLLFICSCSVLKKKELKTASSTQLVQGSKTVAATIDTSKKITTEHWQFTFPTAKPKLPENTEKFEPVSLPDLSGATTDQRDAVQQLQGKYSSLLRAYNQRGNELDDAEGYMQGMTLDIRRKIEENTGKSSMDQKQDSLKRSTANQTGSTETKKQPNWTLIIIGACVVLAALGLAYKFFKK